MNEREFWEDENREQRQPEHEHRDHKDPDDHSRDDDDSDHDDPKNFSVVVVYNGLTKTLKHVNAHETVGAVCERAMNLFEIQTNRHILALWLGAERELINDQTVEAAGVHAGDTLLLRPSQVRGG